MGMNRRSFLRRGAGLLALGAAAALPRQAQAGDTWYPWGMDVSHWQGTINWDTVAAAGITFSFVKATEGTTYRDPRYDFNYAEMARVGIFRGAYHFGRPGTSAVTQADFFVDTANPGSGDLLLCLDLEVTDNKTPAQVWSWTQAFVAEVQNRTGFPPFIYTSPYFWTSRVGNPTDNLGCPLWIAHWNVSWPTVPRAWADWTFWQYADNGSVPGISGAVDQDTFNGAYSDLWSYTY
jgi:lysozyme